PRNLYARHRGIHPQARRAFLAIAQSDLSAEYNALTASPRLFVSAGISAARLDESVSRALFALFARRDLFSAARIAARAKASAGCQRAPDPMFPRLTPPGSRILAPPHDGNRRIRAAGVGAVDPPPPPRPRNPARRRTTLHASRTAAAAPPRPPPRRAHIRSAQLLS